MGLASQKELARTAHRTGDGGSMLMSTEAGKLMTNDEAIKQLLSTTCEACGKSKLPKMSFCRNCYFELTPRLRKLLYSDVGAGYQQYYLSALNYLKEVLK